MVDNLDLKVWQDGPPGRESRDKGQLQHRQGIRQDRRNAIRSLRRE